jgi:tetratricopeptide (TPR) repeat protein
MSFMRNVVAWMIIIIIVLLPLKFGTLAGLPEVSSYYPADGFSWMIITWPAISFPMASGGLLLLALAVFPVRIQDSRVAFTVTALWLLVAFVSIIGAANASAMDYVIVYVTHIFGFAAFGAAAWLMLSNLPEFKRVALWSIFIGTVLTAVLGIEQMFSGFEETRKFVESQEQQYGNSMSGDLKSRVWDNRVFSTFASSGSLAGYLLLTMPLCFFLCWQLCGKIKPGKISRTVFMPPLAALMGMVFFATVSRGAFLALVIACVIFIMIFPVRKSIRIAAFVLTPAVIIAGTLYIAYAGRGFNSMLVRFDYVYTSFLMFLSHPWLGTGWGDFFHDHMALKLTVSKEAPHTAHNILMDFLSQTGFAGFAACLAAIVYPLARIAGKIYNAAGNSLFASLDSYVILGLTAYFVHSLMDVNLQIPASMATALVLMVAMTIPDEKAKAPAGGKKPASKLAANLSAAAAMLIAGLIAVCGGFHLLKADYALSRLSDLCSPQGKSREDYFSVTPEQVKRELANCIAARPYSPFPWAAAADFMLARGYPDAAENFYNKALELSPQRSFIYFRLYMLQKAQGREAEAQKNLDIARKLFPHNADYYPDKQTRKPPGPLKD